MVDGLTYASFADADPGSGLSYEQMMARRKMAEALMGQKKYPANLGEGIASAGQSIADALIMKRMGDEYKAVANRDQGVPNTIAPSTLYGGGDSAGAPAVVAASPPPDSSATAPSPPPDVPMLALRSGTQQITGNAATFPEASPAATPLDTTAGVTQAQADAGRNKLAAMLVARQGMLTPTPEGGQATAVPFAVSQAGGGPPPAPALPASAAPPATPAVQVQSRMAPLGVGGTTGAGIGTAPDAGNPPIRTDIPPVASGLTNEQQLLLSAMQGVPAITPMQAPGPDAKPPGLMPPTLRLRQLEAVMNDPRYGPGLRGWAKEQRDRELEGIKTLQERQQEAFTHTRDQREKDVKEYRTSATSDFKLYTEAQTAAIDQMNKMIAAGRPYQEARDQAVATLNDTLGRIAERNIRVNTPDVQIVNGVPVQIPKGTTGVAYPIPGAPPKDLEAKQSEIIRDLPQGLRASEYLTAGATPLTSRWQHTLGAVPLDLGKGFQSAEFQKQETAGKQWADVFLRNSSGGQITGVERDNEEQRLLPQINDTPERLVVKAALRKAKEESVYASLGNQRWRADQIVADRAARVAPGIPENTWQQSSSGKLRVMHNGRWEDPLPGEQPPAR